MENVAHDAPQERREGVPVDMVAYSALSAHTGPPTVLVVDDESCTQLALDRLLAFYRFLPLQASDLSGATMIAAREQVDAFIVDLTLGPGRSGLDMVGWVRQQQEYVAVPVFVLTSNLDIPDDERTLIRQHRAHVFYKGQSFELLIDCLRRALVDPDALVRSA